MKNTLYIILLMLLSLTVKAQQTTIEGVAKIELNNGFEKITAKQAVDHVNAKFKNKKFAESKYRSGKFIYRYKNILVQFYSDKQKYNDGALSQIQHGLTALNPQNKNYSSEIRKMKNGDVLLTKNLISGTEHFDFFFINTAGTERISGEFQFNPEDEVEANALMERILKSVQFTE